MWWQKLKQNVLNTSLYSRSGTEVGLSEGTLSLEEKGGDYFVAKQSDGDIPELSYAASSDRVINYPVLNQSVFGCEPDNWLIGTYEKIYVGYISDEKIRRNSSSGGILSGTQAYLLRSGRVDGAVTLRMREDKPYLTEPIVATSEAEIFNASQSKYTVAPVNQILPELKNYSSVVYTGLPEQIASIRKLQHLQSSYTSSISYVLGMFYGETLGFSAVRSLLRAHRAGAVSDIKTIQFRAGEWPGYLSIVMKNGREIRVPKFYANYLSPSHVTKYSLYQVDYMAELADISCGDAWSPVYEERGKGWSVVLARTKKGLDLLTEMQSEGVVSLSEISKDELINMHSLGLDVKKRGAFIRIARRRMLGLPVPKYGYEPVNIPWRRYMFEWFFGFVVLFCHLRVVIFILEQVPVGVIGRIFVYVRKIWKSTTRSTKTAGLAGLRFRTLPLAEL